MNAMRTRVVIWRVEFWRPWLGVVILILTVAGAAPYLADHTAMPDGWRKFIRDAVPVLDAPAWGLIGLAIAFVVALEAIYRVAHERNAVIAERDRKRTDQAFADRLIDKLHTGIDKILNGGPNAQQNEALWRSAEGAWTQDVINALKAHGCSKQEVSLFEYLQEVPTQPQFHSDASIDHLYRMTNLRLHRLRSIIDRYSEGPAMSEIRRTAR